MENLKNPQKLFLLSIVGLITLIVGTQIITVLSVNERTGEARTINLAGRQRMLSQKITKLAYQYRDTGEQVILNEMRAAAENWNQVQQGLQYGSELLGLEADAFSEDDALFQEMRPAHDAIYQIISTANYNTDPFEILDAVSLNEEKYLELMDAAVFSMQAESERNNKKTGTYKLVFFVVIMMMTGGIGFVFIRPLRKQIKKELSEEELNNRKLFRAVFDSTFNFCGIAKPDGSLIELNQPALEFTQLKPEEVKGLKLQEGPWWTGQEQRDKAQLAVDEAGKGKVARFDLEVQGADGTKLIIDFSIVPILDEEGNVSMIIPEGRDISEKIRFIEEVRETNESLEEAQRIGKVGNWHWDMIEDEISWSDLNYEVFGMPKTFKPNFEDLNRIIHPEDREQFQKDVEVAIKENKAHDFVHRIVLNDGKEIRYIHERGKVFYNDDGAPVRMAGTSQDVTQVYEKEEELEAQKEELQNALELLSETQNAAKIGSWEVDLETQTCYWSDEVYSIHEVDTNKEIKVEDGINYYREDFRPVIQNAINEAIEKNTSWDVECVLITETRNELWVRATGHPVFEDEKLVKLRGLFMNIDKEKRAVEERIESELIFRSIFDSTFNFTGLLEPDGTLIEANKSALEFGGFTMEQAKGLKFYDAPWWSLSEEIRDELKEAIKKAAQGEFIRYDVPVVGADGNIITIDFSIIPTFDEEGNVIYLVPEGRDISEKLELAEQLELSEKQLRTFIEQAPAAVAMFDKDMNYITASNEWYQHNNIEGEEITGRCHYDVIPTVNDRADWKKAHREVLNGEELYNSKDKYVNKDGDEMWISWKAIPWYTVESEVGGMILFVSDVTTEVLYTEKLEEEVEQRTKQIKAQAKALAETNKELESFSYTISHDLRAPLRSINGFSDILLEDYSKELDEEGQRLIGIVKNSAVEMGTLIDDILNFSRLGRKSIQKSDIDMNLLFKSICEEEKKRYSDQSMYIKISNLSKIPGDISLIKQVVTNLISNAFKYSSKKEKIEIEVLSVENPDHIMYSIKDNGVGFDMDYHDKLFGVFQRLHSKNEFEGTGVGLAIAKRIINKHGGEMWAEGEIGKGSTFFFSLPKK